MYVFIYKYIKEDKYVEIEYFSYFQNITNITVLV